MTADKEKLAEITHRPKDASIGVLYTFGAHLLSGAFSEADTVAAKGWSDEVPFFGEFMGNLMLVLLGNGAVANVLLKKSKGEGSGWMVITTGWALAVMSGVFTAIACGSSDAHINPAVTLGFAVSSGDYSKIIPYSSAQILGAFVGAVVVWIHYGPHWAESRDPKRKLACFCTGPAIRNLPANILSELIGTFVLIFVIGAIFSKAVASGGPAAGLGPYLVGSLVWGIGISLGGTTGFAINRQQRVARSLLKNTY